MHPASRVRDDRQLAGFRAQRRARDVADLLQCAVGNGDVVTAFVESNVNFLDHNLGYG